MSSSRTGCSSYKGKIHCCNLWNTLARISNFMMLHKPTLCYRQYSIEFNIYVGASTFCRCPHVITDGNVCSSTLLFSSFIYVCYNHLKHRNYVVGIWFVCLSQAKLPATVCSGCGCFVCVLLYCTFYLNYTLILTEHNQCA
jgi:hypothetical protein